VSGEAEQFSHVESIVNHDGSLS